MLNKEGENAKSRLIKLGWSSGELKTIEIIPMMIEIQPLLVNIDIDQLAGQPEMVLLLMDRQ